MQSFIADQLTNKTSGFAHKVNFVAIESTVRFSIMRNYNISATTVFQVDQWD